MSRIDFEWEIESQKRQRPPQDDVRERRQRQRRLMLFGLLLLLLAGGLGLFAFVVNQRLLDRQRQEAQLLQDTVKAEVAALRIGDAYAWLSRQDPEDEGWLQEQREHFAQVDRWKVAEEVELPGSILAVHMEDQRARVLVQENWRGLPYARLWFYRRDDSGWRHTAPDPGFWGESRQIIGDGITVDYFSADEAFAQALAGSISATRSQHCEQVDCSELPTFSVQVQPLAEALLAWANAEETRLLIRSPYADRARADLPFDKDFQMQVEQLLEQRLLRHRQVSVESAGG